VASLFRETFRKCREENCGNWYRKVRRRAYLVEGHVATSFAATT
jgi:hypothetical protein